MRAVPVSASQTEFVRKRFAKNLDFFASSPTMECTSLATSEVNEPMRRSIRELVCCTLLGLLFRAVPLAAQEKKEATPAPKSDPAILTIDRIFDSKDFELEKVPAIRWACRGSGYVTLESGPHGQQLIAHDPATGRKETLVPDHWLIPAGETRPLAVEGYDFSDDGARLLLYTNSKRVWRLNTRGDYWLLDLSTRELKKLGGDIPASTMMFATFSPDGTRVAFVHKNNLYVQDLLDLRVTPLTKDGSDTLINGTFDWVYEEELYLRNGFRWSPDSTRIAYWQLDSSGVKEFFITASDDGPYSHVVSIRYPKTGERNSAARIGVVDAKGGSTTWLRIAGDPREYYLAKLEWNGEQHRRPAVQSASEREPRHDLRPEDGGRQHDPRRKGRRVGRERQRFPMDRRRQEVRLAQRARRLATSLPGE